MLESLKQIISKLWTLLRNAQKPSVNLRFPKISQNTARFFGVVGAFFGVVGALAAIVPLIFQIQPDSSSENLATTESKLLSGNSETLASPENEELQAVDNLNPEPAQEKEPSHCDRLAANPRDSQRQSSASGVSLDKITAEATLSCRAELSDPALLPERKAQLQYQYARALHSQLEQGSSEVDRAEVIIELEKALELGYRYSSVNLTGLLADLANETPELCDRAEPEGCYTRIYRLREGMVGWKPSEQADLHWMKIHRYTPEICPDGREACKSAGAMGLEDLFERDELEPWGNRTLAHQYLAQVETPKCTDKPTCDNSAFSAFTIAAKGGDLNAELNVAWMKIHRQTQEICPEGSKECAVTGTLELEALHQDGKAEAWAIRSLAHQYLDKIPTPICSNEEGCNNAAFLAFSEASEGGDINARANVNWVMMHRPTKTICPDGFETCVQEAIASLKALVDKNLADPVELNYYAIAHLNHPGVAPCQGKEDCRNKAFDLLNASKDAGNERGRARVAWMQINRFTNGICPEGTAICRHTGIQTLEVMRKAGTQDSFALNALADAYRYYPNDADCTSAGACLSLAVSVYKEAGLAGNDLADGKIQVMKIRHADNPEFCSSETECLKAGIAKLIKLNEAGTLDSVFIDDLADAYVTHWKEAGCDFLDQCRRKADRLLRDEAKNGVGVAASRLMEALVNDEFAYATEDNACRKNDKDWRSCAEEVRDLLITAARDGIIPKSIEEYAYNVSKEFLVDLGTDRTGDWRNANKLVGEKLDETLNELYNEEQVLFIKDALAKIWEALNDGQKNVAIKQELYAISLPYDIHICRWSKTCSERLRELGERSVRNHDLGFAKEQFYFAIELRSNELLGLSASEFNAFADTIVDAVSEASDPDVYLMELERITNARTCTQPPQLCLNAAARLGEALIDNAYSPEFPRFARRLESFAEIGELRVPDIVPKLIAISIENGDVEAIRGNLRDRMYSQGEFSKATLERDPALLRDAIDGLEKFKAHGSLPNIAATLRDIAFIEMASESSLLSGAEIFDLLLAHDIYACWSKEACRNYTMARRHQLPTYLTKLVQDTVGTTKDGVWGLKTSEAYSDFVMGICSEASERNFCLKNQIIKKSDFLIERYSAD